MKKILAKALTVVGISNAQAEWAEVSCVKRDGSSQYLQIDSQVSTVTVSGQWNEGTTVNDDRHFNFFTISEASYNSIKDQCQQEYVAKPVNTSSSLLSVFHVYSQPYWGISFSLQEKI